MEQSLPHISAHNKEFQPNHQGTTATPSVTNRTTEADTGYDTHLIPHISLPQRYQANGNEQRAGLLHSIRQQDPTSARHTSDYTTEFRKSDLTQASTDNSALRWNTQQTQQTPPALATLQQTPMQKQQVGGAREQMYPQSHYSAVKGEERRSLAGKPDWTLSIEPGKPSSVAHQRLVLLTRALVSLIMFTGITYAIWTIFSHNSLYTLILFTVLAVALGTILSISLGDYYQLGLRKLKPSTLPLPAMRIPGPTNVWQERYRAPLPGEQHFKVPRRPIEYAPLQQEKKPGNMLMGQEGNNTI